MNGEVHSLRHRGDWRNLLHAVMLRLVRMMHGLGRTVMHVVATCVRLLLLLLLLRRWRHGLCCALQLRRLGSIHIRHVRSRHRTIHVS